MSNKKLFKGIYILLPIFLFLFVTFGLAAKKNKSRQENPHAQIKVSYDYYLKFLYIGGEKIGERTVPMLLLIGSTDSKFYCPHTQYLDSLKSTPSGKKISDKLLQEAVKKANATGDRSAMSNVVYKTSLYVFKNRKDSLIKVYDRTGLFDYGTYDEPIEKINWQIKDSTRSILGYECINAEGDFHGRRWSVWFTPEIPVSEGPWKLSGLPGLILEASEPTGQHHFTATGIEKTDMEIVPMIWKNCMYDKMKRFELLKSKSAYIHNGNSMIEASIGLKLGQDALPTDETKLIDFLETDYH